MSTIPNTQITESTTGTVDIATWTPLTFSGLDSGAPVSLAGSADRSVQVEGTFGAGGTLLIEGSNDNINWRTLKDHLGNLLSFTSADIRSVDQIVRYIRPRITGGDGTTSLTVTMLLRRLFT